MLSALNDVPLPRLLVLMNAPVVGLSTFGDTVADAQTRWSAEYVQVPDGCPWWRLSRAASLRNGSTARPLPFVHRWPTIFRDGPCISGSYS